MLVPTTSAGRKHHLLRWCPGWRGLILIYPKVMKRKWWIYRVNPWEGNSPAFASKSLEINAFNFNSDLQQQSVTLPAHQTPQKWGKSILFFFRWLLFLDSVSFESTVLEVSPVISCWSVTTSQPGCLFCHLRFFLFCPPFKLVAAAAKLWLEVFLHLGLKTNKSKKKPTKQAEYSVFGFFPSSKATLPSPGWKITILKRLQ